MFLSKSWGWNRMRSTLRFWGALRADPKCVGQIIWNGAIFHSKLWTTAAETTQRLIPTVSHEIWFVYFTIFHHISPEIHHGLLVKYGETSLQFPWNQGRNHHDISNATPGARLLCSWMDAPSRYRFGARGHGAGGTLMSAKVGSWRPPWRCLNSGFLHGMIINTDISKFNHWYDVYFMFKELFTIYLDFHQWFASGSNTYHPGCSRLMIAHSTAAIRSLAAVSCMV